MEPCLNFYMSEVIQLFYKIANSIFYLPEIKKKMLTDRPTLLQKDGSGNSNQEYF